MATEVNRGGRKRGPSMGKSLRSRGGVGRGRGRGVGNGGRGAAASASSSSASASAPASASASASPDVSLPSGLPKNWPPEITYLTTPFYSGISPRQRQLLQTQPADMPGAPVSTRPLPEIPPILRFGPSPAVEIRSITDPAHPACGQRGLFAAKHLPAGSFILPYLGVYHRGHVSVGGGGTNLHNKRESDYDLWLDRDADVAIDADRKGNEARFVNDYRGTGKPRACAEFREVWDPRRGERGMAVYVLPAGKRAIAAGAPTGIAKGEEILVSYGKGFWEMRQKEAEAAKEAAAVQAGGGQDAEGAADASGADTCEDSAAGNPQTVSDAPAVSSMLVAAKIPKNVWSAGKGLDR